MTDPNRELARRPADGGLAAAASAPPGRPLLEGLDPEAQRLARASKSARTVVAYDKAWRAFSAWCGPRGLATMPAPPETVANYLADRSSNHKVATLQIDLAAIRQAHLLAGHPSPGNDPKVQSVMAGIRATKGVRPDAKAAMVAEPIRAYLASLPETPRNLRDRALLLVGFAGAFRRSELVGLCVEDVTFQPGDAAVVLMLRFSKTDQEGRGLEKVVHRSDAAASCPVRALRAWMRWSEIASGPVFRKVSERGRVGDEGLHAGWVAKLVKHVASTVGLDPKLFSGHSLRAGFVTAAVAAGVSLPDVQEVTKHRSTDVVMGYIRRDAAMKTNTTRRVI